MEIFSDALSSLFRKNAKLAYITTLFLLQKYTVTGIQYTISNMIFSLRKIINFFINHLQFK